MKRIILVAVLALAFGCGDNNSSNNNAGTNNDTNNGGSGGFEGGSYTVTVLDVDDQCFDGAMNSIVLPDGTARELPAPVTLPAHGDLPAQIDIQFNEPFDDVTGVDVEASGDNGITTAAGGFTQTAVDISGSDTEVCDADMNVTFTLTASEDGKLTGSGTLSVTATNGDDCPAFQEGPPCSVISNLEAVKN